MPSATLTEEQRMIQAGARELARGFSLDYWRRRDREAAFPDDFVRAFAERDWLGMLIPERYGGMGLGITEAALLLHEVAASGAALSGASALHFSIFPSASIVRHGSEEMKRRYLPPIARGDISMAFGVTEPTAGSDTSRITTRAERRDGRWVINGQKVWTTNAQHADRILLLARTAQRDPGRPLDGLTLFFAELDRERCAINVIDKLGRAAVDSNEVFIEDLEVADEDVVGEVGKGFRQLLDSLNPERIVVAMEAVGIGRAALELGVRYANERVVFEQPIGANQAIAHPLAEASIELDAAELVALDAARLFDAEQPCGKQANAAKFLGARAGFRAADAALQTHGGFGYSKEYHVERLWREVRLLRITPVSQEMVLNYIAHKVLGLPKSYGRGDGR